MACVEHYCRGSLQSIKSLHVILFTEAKDVETLLQLMFEGEINPTDEGPENTEEEETVKYSFDAFTL